MEETPPVFEYDAFISYRRSEQAFAQQLEGALEAYKPPRGMGLPDRRLNVFRDESDLDGSDYYGPLGRLERRAGFDLSWAPDRMSVARLHRRLGHGALLRSRASPVARPRSRQDKKL